MFWDSARIKILAVLLTLLLISVIIVLALLRPTLIYEPPFLITALNLLFLTILPFTVAYLAMRSYIASGVPSILLLGGGLIAFGCGSLVAGFTIYLPGGTNLTPTIHNSGALLGSLLITLSAIFAGFKIVPAKAPARAKLYVALVYAGTFAAMAALSIMAIAGLVPTFFVQGVGATMLRQVVLGAAVVLFTVSSIIYLHLYQTVRTYYVFWCGMGFILIAVGLAAVFLQTGVGSMIGWAGRTAQYLGCLYLFIGRGAVVVIAGEKHITVSDEITNLHRVAVNYETLVEIASDAIISIDEKGYILSWNTAADRIFGYHKNEAIGRRFPSVIGRCPLTDYLDAEINIGKQPGGSPIKIISAEFAARRKSGELFQTQISAAGSKHSGSWVFTLIIKDITDHKRWEDALKESEEKYRVLFNNEIYATLIFDLQTLKLLDVNDTYCRMYGYSREELVSGMTIHDITAEHQVSDAATQQAINEGTIFIPLRYHRKKDGTVFTVEIVGGPYVWQGRKVMFALIHDITDRIRSETERKQVQLALRESEEKFKAMVETIPMAIYLSVGVEQISEYISPTMVKLFGYTMEDIPTVAQWWPLAYPDETYRKQISEEWTISIKRAIETQSSIEPMETVVTCKNGAKKNILWGYITMRDKNYAFGLDLTERKLAEDALLQSEEKYRNLVELLHEGIWAIDEDSRTTYANTHMAEMLGYTVEEMQGKELFSFMDERGRELAAQNVERRREGISETHDFEFLRKEGTRIYASLSTTPITGKDGKYKGAVAVVQDITDRKRLEEEQQKVEKLESIGTLAGGIAHNFNNILTMILGNISLAGMEAPDGSELQKSLEQAEKASLRAKDLTLQLLTFSKGGGPVKALGSLTDLLKDTTLSALGDSNVKCRFSIPDGLWQAEIDARQISQVIYNLVINARQAMPEGGTIELMAENIALNKTQHPGKGMPVKAGDYIRVTVTDHGSGIPKEHLGKIFDPFFTTKINAHGLGVPTAFSIVRQHGGHLSVESQVGSGSAFYLYLPASAPKQDKKKAIKAAGKARILVMDDEAGVRETAGRMLKHIGYEDVEFAEHGAEAIKLYKTAMKSGHPFTVAVLDLTIPGGYGGEWTIGELLEIDPGVKAIISSGYIDDPVMAKYSDYGFSGMVAKPYTLDELRNAVQDAIG